MTTDLRAFTSGEPQPVDLASVERQITALWKEASEAEDSQQPAVMRACALTLVVFDDPRSGRKDAAPLDETLSRVTERHPCRILLARIDPEHPAGSLESWVTALCHLSPGAGRSSRVCSEQVTVTAAPEDARHLPGAVLPLAVAELPVFVWWRAALPAEGKTKDAEVFDRFRASADRLLMDGVEPADLLSLLRRYPAVAFGHLEWARLTPWRSAIAQFFDPVEAREYLPRLSKGRIEGGDLRARLLAGWLRSRLKKRPAVEISSGALRAVTLEADSARFHLALAGAAAQATAELPGVAPSEYSLRFEEVPDHQALAQELQVLGHDRVFEEALENAADL